MFVGRGVHGFAAPAGHNINADFSRFDRVMDGTQWLEGLDCYLQLFERLTAQRVLQRLVSLDVASHQIPHARVVPDMRGPLDEQHLAVPYKRSGDAPRDTRHTYTTCGDGGSNAAGFGLSVLAPIRQSQPVVIVERER